MCWLYGECTGVCPVCFRLAQAEKTAAADLIAEKDADSIYTQKYASTIRLPETTRVTRNQYVRTVIFANDVTQKTPTKKKKKKEAVNAGVFSSHSDNLWHLLKRRKTTREMLEATERAAANSKVSSGDMPLGVVRLFKFLAVLHVLGDAPWANVRFEENEQMLRKFVATHLVLIVGREEYDKHRSTLLSIIDSKNNLSKLVHLTWITNRQNGKTTTLAKFLAAMAMVSPLGGPLIYVYSTTRDRAIELIDNSKRYINWVLHTSEIRTLFESFGLIINNYVSNNTIGFALPSFLDPRAVNIIKARPKTADSCRGDAPRACMFDEVGFVTADFWFRFAYPLIQVGERVFLMATTPAHSGTFFAAFTDMVIAAQEKGNHNFSLTNHSVICDECLENGLGAECCHKLNMIPRWKSVLGFNSMKALVPDKRMDDFQKEVFGVIKSDSACYLPAKWVEKNFGKKNMKPLKDVPDKLTVYISVDPPSHGVSFMGCSAIVYTDKGQVYIVGTAEVGIKESEMIQLKHTVGRFVLRVLEQLVAPGRPYRNIEVVPIVECNNNEFQSNDIVTIITETARAVGSTYLMPFTKDFFKKSISEHIGVWTGVVEKLGGLQTIVALMQDKRIVVWDRCVTIGAIHLRRMQAPSIDDALETLRTGLIEFKETPKGPSGKTASNNDDSAMAFILNVYWSYCVRATQMFSKNVW